MKSLRNYLEESDYAANNPVAGDTFAINIREECLIESVVVESRNDGVVIAADDRMIELLESYGYTFEQTCMECGGSGCGCGQDPEEYGDETDAGQNPGEYDQEGDMAKDELLTVIRSARKLIGMLDNDDNMPEWTQKKITKSADYVDTAADYISSQKERGVMEQSADEITVGDIVMLAAGYADTDEKFRVVDVDSDGETCTIKSMETGIVTDEVFTDELEKVNNSSQGVAEGSGETSPVARAILHRIMMAHTGLLAAHGPDRVMDAVDEVADYIGDVEEIGSSDVSGWVRHVEQMLSNMPDELDEQGMAEGSRKAWMKHNNLVDLDPALKGLEDEMEKFIRLDPEEKRKYQQGIKQRIKSDPMAGPKGVLPEQGMTEDLQADDGERYRSADDFFGQFEADHFDEERVSPDGMEVRGYIDGVNVMVWRFDSPRKTSGYGIYDDSGLNEAEVNTSRMNQQHKDFYNQNPHFKRNDRETKFVGNKLATRVNPTNPQQVQKKPATPFGITEAATKASVSKLLRHIERHHPTWFDDYGMGEVEDTVVDMAEQGTFSGMTVVDAAALVGQELESMYGANAMNEAEYQGRKVPLGKPMKGDVAKSKVYVKDPKTGNVKKVNFGDPNMKIKKSNPARRKSFRARHNCDNPGPRTSARYWSCRAW